MKTKEYTYVKNSKNYKSGTILYDLDTEEKFIVIESKRIDILTGKDFQIKLKKIKKDNEDE